MKKPWPLPTIEHYEIHDNRNLSFYAIRTAERYRSCHEFITARNFPIVGSGEKVVTVALICFHRTLGEAYNGNVKNQSEVDAAVDALGYFRGDTGHVFAFAAQHRKVLETKSEDVVGGSRWRRYASGWPFFLCIRGGGNDLDAIPVFNNKRWRKGVWYLTVPKKSRPAPIEP